MVITRTSLCTERRSILTLFSSAFSHCDLVITGDKRPAVRGHRPREVAIVTGQARGMAAGARKAAPMPPFALLAVVGLLAASLGPAAAEIGVGGALRAPTLDRYKQVFRGFAA